MNARRKAPLQRCAWILAALLLLLAFPVGANANGVMEHKVTDNSVVLYVRNPGDAAFSEASIGQQKVDSAYIAADSSSTQVVTWLLYDNSMSVLKEDRPKALNLLAQLVSARSPNERFVLCTFAEHLSILRQDSTDYIDLKTLIDSIQTYDQETYLTDVLCEVLDKESEREGQEFVRILVISDGVDNNAQGINRSELNDRLAKSNIPIYTLGCENNTRSNAQDLKDMYELSRRTGGLDWSLSALTDTLNVVSTMRNDIPLRAEVSVPEDLRDGGEKKVRITFTDESFVEDTVVMPLDTNRNVPLPPLPDDTENEIEEPWTMPGWLIVLLVVLTLLAAAGGLAYWLLVVKKINPFRSMTFPPPEEGSGETESYDIDSPAQTGGTESLFGDTPGRRYQFTLTDEEDSSRRYKEIFEKNLIIGRVKVPGRTMIVLDFDKSVSGQHCQIFLDGNILKIKDLDSKNGTYIGSEKIVNPTELLDGSVIQIGKHKYRVDIQ